MAAELQILQDPGQAAAMLYHPVRVRILQELRAPDSAASVARRLGLPRQTVNYHVRALARAKLLARAGRRKKRQFVEQCYVTSSQAYVFSADILGALGGDSARIQDRFSAAYLVALAADLQRDLGKVASLAEAAGKRIATWSMSADLAFSSAEQRAAFARSLERAVLTAVAEHGVAGDTGAARPFRLILGCYPAPPKP